MGREDFLLSESNGAAVEAVESLSPQTGGVLVIVGPAGSGKTHLAQVWRSATGAAQYPARGFDETAAAHILELGAGIIEDLPCAPGAWDERAFFHVLNAAVEGRAALLMTARQAPPAWGIATEDVRTRLRLARVAAITAPDDSLLAAVILKLMADRQMTVAANALRYALPRIERSFAAAEAFVREVERVTLQRRKPATLGVVREVVDRMSSVPE